MSFFWNKEIKRLMAAIAAILSAGVLCSSFVISTYCNAVGREFNLAVASMLDSVRSSYPDASEENLMSLLRGNTDSGAGERLLGQYGVFLEESGSTFAGLKEKEAGFSKSLTVVFLITGVSMAAVLYIYLKHRQSEIGKLCSYMVEVGKGNFSLDAAGNREDELSGLKNELYKLAVFLKEQAKTAINNRKALADAVADISHQLKTPLTSVTVLVDNLLENQNMEPAVRTRFLREISIQLSGVSWLIATLLKLSRLDAGVVQFERKPLSVKKLVEEVYRKLEISAEWRQVGLKLQISDGIWVYGDEQWLTEAFINLVKNAIEHSEEGGEVLVYAEENDVYTLVAVKDHGEGISREEQKNLFQRFYRGHSAGRDNVGIGLSLAKEIIVRQEGYISVESEKESGTVFLVKFMKCH